jgi:hypothetical protein
MSLIFTLQKNNGGFFCQMWKLASNYLYAQKNNLDFLLEDSEWMFKHNLGWRDYFSSLQLLSEATNLKHPLYRELDVEDVMLHQFTLNQYKSAFREIYILNASLKERYLKHKIAFSLVDSYCSIMIRRGDKMYGESQYVETNEYVEKILEKKPKKIYVQTDDYNSYDEVCRLVKTYSTNIQLFTTCPTNKFGAFVFNFSPHVGSKLSELNNSYLLNLANNVQKSVNEYSSEEMREHVEEMLVGMEFCIQSKCLVTDLQSNVTRFLFCNSNSVISVGNVEGPNFDTILVFPAKGFIEFP